MISAFLAKCSCMIVFMIATSPKPVRHHLVRFRFVLIFVFYFHFCVFHCNFHFSSFLTNVSLFHITFFLGPALSSTSCMSIFPSTSPITISSLYLKKRVCLCDLIHKGWEHMCFSFTNHRAGKSGYPLPLISHSLRRKACACVLNFLCSCLKHVGTWQHMGKPNISFSFSFWYGS